MEIAMYYSSSSVSSSTFPPACLTSASRNAKLSMQSTRAICTLQRAHPCSGGKTEAFVNCRYNVVARYSQEFSETTKSLLFKQPYRNRYPLGASVTPKIQDVSTRPSIGDEKIGVLLLNLGGPETLDDVQPFLFNLFADPDIIRLPRLFRFLQKPLAQFISVLRAPKSREGYSAIGGGSPLRRITDEQAEELRKSLCSKDVPAKVYVGMRYWHPFTEEAIEQIKIDGITQLVVLPLYPQFSISTSGDNCRRWLLYSIVTLDHYTLITLCNNVMG